MFSLCLTELIFMIYRCAPNFWVNLELINLFYDLINDGMFEILSGQDVARDENLFNNEHQLFRKENSDSV